MTIFSVTSIKKAISEFQEDSTQFPTQQKSDPLFPSGWTKDTSGRLSVFEKILNSSAFQRASVQMTRQHHQYAIQCSRRIRDFFADTNWEDSLQLSGCSLNKETYEARYRKAVTVYRLDTLSLSLDAAKRTLNQC
jgi:hypothetical protein